MYFLNSKIIKKRQIWKSLLLVTVTLFFMIGCSSEEPTSITGFTISMNNVADYSVSVLVTHDGTNRDNYYVFVVKGEDADIKSEIIKHHESLQISESPYDQKKRIVLLKGLVPESTYTCIIYGVDESGEPNGIFASTTFKTTETNIFFEENPNWQIYYGGQGSCDGLTYSQVMVYVEGSVEERYFICIHDKTIVDTYPETKDFIIYAYNTFVNEHNDKGDEYFWLEDDFVRTESTVYYKYLHKGTYQAFAIGVDYNGNLTGHYAISDAFEFEKYKLDSEYEYLLGDWKITDDIGGEIYVTFSESWANHSFTLSGWGNNDIPFRISHYPYSLEYALELNHQSVLGRAWGEDADKLFELVGWYLDTDGSFKLMSYNSYLALAKRNDDGSFTFNSRFSKTLSDGEKAKTLGIVVIYTDEDNKRHYYNSSKLQFPLTMRKI